MPNTTIALAAALIVLLTISAGFSAEPATQPTPRTGRIKIVLAGDSTVTDNAGWGGAFAKLLKPDAQVINISRGGRSSMSFIEEGRWKTCLVEKPDYVFIQFGHNDEPGKPGRSTELPEYRKYMTQYITDARTAGIKPVLVTCLSRRQFKDGKINSSLAPRVEIIREIAAEYKVPVIDLHTRSIELYEKLGPEGVAVLSPPKEGGKLDGTHLNEAGARMVAPLIVEEMKKAVPALAEFAQ